MALSAASLRLLAGRSCQPVSVVMILASNLLLMVLVYSLMGPAAPQTAPGLKSVGVGQQVPLPPQQPCASCPPCDVNKIAKQLQAQQTPCPEPQIQYVPEPCPEPLPQPPAPQSAPVAAPTYRDAILGLAKGLGLREVYNFVRSLRSHAPPTIDVLLFTDNLTPDIQAMFDAFKVTALVYAESDLAPKVRRYHPSSYRWILMDDYLSSLTQPYDRLMFVDVRDTVFQGDPFAVVTQPGFYAFLEAAPKTIRECGWNRGWVQDCFGDQVLAQVANKIISCSGTSLGTWDASREYVTMMRTEVERNPCERNGVDQGMHNVFVHTGRLAQTFLFTNEQGPIATVQSMATLNRNRFGQLLNQDGNVYAVVHQYDRSPALKAQYEREYVLLQSQEQHEK